ncbi:hypothetical protein L6164_022258 [Bauhinia variegata]|uniref:Uncharacterized protein n=1 Tax=Bauhinia variegata TaxID=167791 RepID=A0ACB9MF20_BAUVA|nr:hypothetical protein L6164_022258 [Bauhinia variegata]
MKFFSELKSCYRPQVTPVPPSADDSHRVPPDLQHITRSRLRRPRSSHWRPVLSSIAEDQDSSVDRESYRRSSSKSRTRTRAKIRSLFQSDQRFGNSMPMRVAFAGFAATPFMI